MSAQFFFCVAVTCMYAAQLIAQQPVTGQQSALLTPDDFFRRAGDGLRGIGAERRDYWQPHITNSHRRILEAASLCKKHATALVLGAGNCTEIPLEELARRFDEVILVDLDEDSMSAAIEDLPDDLIPKVRRRVQDVTTFAEPLMQQLWHLVEKSTSADQALDGFERILNAQDSKAPSGLPQADLVVSSLVLSELHRYPLSYAARLMLDKFGERLPAWSGYEGFRARLQQIALRDHVALLANSVRSDGAIYYADTIERGPLYENVKPAQKQEVMTAVFPDLAELGFFGAIQQEGPLRHTFLAAFEKMRARWKNTRQSERPDATPDPTVEAVIQQLGQEHPSVSPADRGAACETVINLLCEGRYPINAEIAAFERVLHQYAPLPDSFEPLVPLDAVQQEWRSRDLKVSGTTESWWWLEYPCSISYSSGSFQIRSWILQK